MTVQELIKKLKLMDPNVVPVMLYRDGILLPVRSIRAVKAVRFYTPKPAPWDIEYKVAADERHFPYEPRCDAVVITYDVRDLSSPEQMTVQDLIVKLEDDEIPQNTVLVTTPHRDIDGWPTMYLIRSASIAGAIRRGPNYKLAPEGDSSSRFVAVISQ